MGVSEPKKKTNWSLGPQKFHAPFLLCQKCSNLQEEVFHLTNNLVIPEDKTLIDTAALNDIEGMFSKFNTFLTALSNLGISNTEKLHKADIKKIEQMLEDI